MKKFFLFAAVAMLALVGCEKPKQSSLDFDKVEKEATVSGTLVAYVNAPGAATETTPLEGIRVYIQVGSKEYQDDAAGNQQFETKTAADGTFTIKVKTGAKEIKNVKLFSDDFKYTIGERTIYYKHLDVDIDDLNAGDVRVEYVVAEEDAVLNQTVGVGIITGKVTYDAGTIKKADGTLEKLSHAYAAGANVIATVTYFEKTDDEVKKVFTAKANANGEYKFEIPVENAGNNLKLSLEQYKATYTKYANNTWTTEESYYTLETPIDAKAIANETNIQAIAYGTRKAIEADTKTQIAFNVKGVLKKEVEKAVKTGDNTTSWTNGSEIVTEKDYTFTIQLDYYGDPVDKTKVTSTILYEGLNVNKADGQFLYEVKLYDGWDINKVKVSAYADKSIKLAAGKFEHHYLAFQASDEKFKKYTDGWTTQENLEGIYKGGPDNKLVKDKAASDSQLFFALDLGTLLLEFEPESKAKLIGVTCTEAEGGIACENDKNSVGAGIYLAENTKVVDGKTYSLGINGCVWPTPKP